MGRYVYGILEYSANGDTTVLDQIFEDKKSAYLYMVNTYISNYSNRGYYFDKFPESVSMDIYANTGDLFKQVEVCTFKFNRK